MGPMTRTKAPESWMSGVTCPLRGNVLPFLACLASVALAAGLGFVVLRHVGSTEREIVSPGGLIGYDFTVFWSGAALAMQGHARCRATRWTCSTR